MTEILPNGRTIYCEMKTIIKVVLSNSKWLTEEVKNKFYQLKTSSYGYKVSIHEPDQKPTIDTKKTRKETQES